MSVPYGVLRSIADELRNIRKILEKQSSTQTKTQNANLTFLTFEKEMEDIQTQIIEFPDTHQKFIFERKVEMDGDSMKISGWEYKGAIGQRG